MQLKNLTSLDTTVSKVIKQKKFDCSFELNCNDNLLFMSKIILLMSERTISYVCHEYHQMHKMIC